MSTNNTESGDSIDDAESVTGPESVGAALDALKTIGNQYPSIQDSFQAERFGLDITDEYVEVLFRWHFPTSEFTELDVAQKIVDVDERLPSGVEGRFNRSEEPDLIQLDVRVRHAFDTSA